MDSIPAELLDLQARFNSWRAQRTYIREPIPEQLRQAALEMGECYPAALLQRVLKVNLWKLKQDAAAKASSRKAKRSSSTTAFFTLPEVRPFPISSSPASSETNCRLQIERPDGARLILTIPALDFSTLHQLCSHFLRA